MTTDGTPGRTGEGHLFLVRGRIESVVHDAAVVPTDGRFGVEERWQPVLGGSALADLRPQSWPCGQARAADGSAVWFISVDDGDGLPTEELVERLLSVVHEAATAGLRPSNNRVKPVLAVPVLGLEGGGHDRDRGDVVQALLAALSDAVTGVDLDVVVVTPEASVYAAAQHVRRGLADAPSDPVEREHVERLGRLAREGSLALFMGAGVGVPAGLPSWDQMLRLLAERTGNAEDLDTARLTRLDRAQLLQRRVPDLGEHVVAICREHDRPSLAHALLAGLRVTEAVTTNYDRLYETALGAAGQAAVAVVPWESPQEAPSWVLKLHGDVGDPASIVLTRLDVVRFDARTRPSGSVLQTLLLTRHLLIVGASMTDENVVRLAQEVQVYREAHGLKSEFGTLLDVDDDAARSELWQGQLAWLTMGGESAEERSRSLEIFLDAVAAHAVADAPWLLDPRFSGLLDEGGERLAEQARDLRGALARAGPEWAQLRDALDALGAGQRE